MGAKESNKDEILYKLAPKLFKKMTPRRHRPFKKICDFLFPAAIIYSDSLKPHSPPVM